MRRAVAFTMLLLHVFTLTAEARRIHVSPTGSNSSATWFSTGTATWTGTPLQTIDNALNVKAISGDSVLLAAGTYSGGIVPTRTCSQGSCPFANVTVIGDSTTSPALNPNSVIVPSISLQGTSTRHEYPGWAIIGVRVNGDVNVSDNPNGDHTDVDGLVLRYVTVNGNYYGTDVDANLYRVRVGLGVNASGVVDSAGSRFKNYAALEPLTMVMDRCRIWASPKTSTEYTDKAIDLWADNDVNTDPDVNNIWNTYTATRCTLRTYAIDGWSPPKPTGFRALRNCRFSDNIWELVDSTGNSSLSQGLLFRDRLIGNVWLRDRFIVRSARAGSGAGRIRLTASGSLKEGHDNTWRYCTFTTNAPVTSDAVGFDWQIQAGDSFYRNVVACSTNTSGAGFSINNVHGVAYMGRNTFYNRGTGGAVLLNDDDSDCPYMSGGTLIFESNILYSRSTGTGGGDYAMNAIWPNRSPQMLASDYNLFAHYGATNGTRSMLSKFCGGSASGKSPGATGTLWSQLKIDFHSRHGSPQFGSGAGSASDSSWANFNPTLLATSAAIGAGRPANGRAVDCGAMDFDVTRPGAVDDLHAGFVGTTGIALAWTATGDDSLTGQAASYEIRYSTSLITEANWSSATLAVGTIPTPSVAGFTDTKTVSGLTLGSLYYFALKVTDDIGYQSAISNCTAQATQTEGPDISDP